MRRTILAFALLSGVAFLCVGATGRGLEAASATPDSRAPLRVVPRAASPIGEWRVEPGRPLTGRVPGSRPA